eukprot:scaffold108511_cov57-Phaeocystis_antarctica.AAC.1
MGCEPLVHRHVSRSLMDISRAVKRGGRACGVRCVGPRGATLSPLVTSDEGRAGSLLRPHELGTLPRQTDRQTEKRTT